jgi:hypothetical protein
MDGAAGFPQLAHELGQMIASSVLPGGALATDAAEDPRKVTFDLWNTDWNSVSSVSQVNYEKLIT